VSEWVNAGMGDRNDSPTPTQPSILSGPEGGGYNYVGGLV